MLKPPFGLLDINQNCQPPSGGCVLKLDKAARAAFGVDQPPSGGCVLKHFFPFLLISVFSQPPSGGCVLKR